MAVIEHAKPTPLTFRALATAGAFFTCESVGIRHTAAYCTEVLLRNGRFPSSEAVGTRCTTAALPKRGKHEH